LTKTLFWLANAVIVGVQTKMQHVKRLPSCALLITMLVSGLILVLAANLGVVHGATDVSGIIGSDTTWTKASSPYSLTGNMLVNNGVTLTIETGVTVNINDYYIMVNGTLRARGSGADKIHFNSGEIIFTQYSNGWNEQTSSGCILENAHLNATSISSDDSLKITNVYSNAPISAVGSSIISYCSLTAEISVGDVSVISHSSLSAETSVGDSATVTDNTITDDIHAGNLTTIANNNINGSVISGSSSIVNNTITGIVTVRDKTSDSSEIRNNKIRGGGAVWYFGLLPFPRYAEYPRTAIDIAGGTVVISNNTIISHDVTSQIYGMEVPDSEFDGGYGITIQANCVADIQSNVISGGFVRGINVVGAATIQGNLIINNSGGIAIGKNVYDYGIGVSEGDVIIRDNTLANSEVGIGGSVVSSYYGQVDYSATPKARTVTIERNMIVGSQKGIDVDLQDATLNIQNNTITDCSEAITLTSCPSATIKFNNIQNFTQRSITLVNTPVNIDATYNWWGTTDASAINQSIYDYKKDFYLGTVNFTPFLTEPNPEAEPNSTYIIPEFQSWIILPLLLTSTLLIMLCRRKLSKTS
jgi:hypothetical protein